MRLWQPSPSCPLYLPDMTMWSCSTSILHSCPSFPEPQTGFLLLWIRSRNTWQCVLASAIQSLSGSVSVSWLSPAVMGSLVTNRLLICCFGVILVVRDVRSRSGVTPEWKGFDNKNWGNNLGLSSCAVPRSTVARMVAYFRRTELLPGVSERSGIDW